MFQIKAGKMTNEEEIEKMLESGNPQIFTEGVSGWEELLTPPPSMNTIHNSNILNLDTDRNEAS